jgi:peptidoglycan/LPS O-acetylase OafA/YrhL
MATIPGTAPADHGTAAIAYRPDIDGLRALAVLAVVLFHAGAGWLPGGFTGVDIFFVISGYLIGGQIHREASTGRFRFGGFYTRRVRRILPALFALLLVLYALGLLLLTPAELRELGKEAVPTVWGASNLLFYWAGDYFAPAAEKNPLLMTWSLGVEEQFYLLFPFVILVAMRLARGAVRPLVAVLTILSFAASLLLIARDPQAAFYLIPTRAWELGVGAWLALREDRPGSRPPSAVTANAMGLLAVALLAASLTVYRPGWAFPGLFAAIPVAGAALLIAARGSVVNTWAFGNRPATFVGRVSYSFYLWHWPVFYLARTLGEGGTGASPVALVLLSFALAVLSWRFVEQPLRHRVLGERTVLLRYAGAAALVSALGAALYLANGLPGRLPPLAQRFALEAMRARANVCLARYGVIEPRRTPDCLPALAPGQNGRVLLLGDSHASALAPGLAQAAAAAGYGFGELTKSSCLALSGLARPTPDRAGFEAECRAFNDRAFAAAAAPDVRVVVLAGYWSNGAIVRDAAGRQVPLADALADTVARLERMGRRVALVQDVPAFAFDPYPRVVGTTLPLRRSISTWLGVSDDATGIAPRSQVMRDAMRAPIAAIGQRAGRILIDPRRALCTAAGCRYAAPDALYYQDFQHLTAAGARAVTDRDAVAARLRPSPVDPPGPAR